MSDPSQQQDRPGPEWVRYADPHHYYHPVLGIRVDHQYIGWNLVEDVRENHSFGSAAAACRAISAAVLAWERAKASVFAEEEGKVAQRIQEGLPA